MFHYKGNSIQDKGMGRSSFFCDGQLRHNQELGKVTVETSQKGRNRLRYVDGQVSFQGLPNDFLIAGFF